MKRALAEAVISLRAPAVVVQDMMHHLGPVPAAHMDAYRMTAETYGTSRMLLAVLEQDLLSKVVCDFDSNFYDVLQPVRHVRPVNGGPGYSEGLLGDLRALNFELS